MKPHLQLLANFRNRVLFFKSVFNRPNGIRLLSTYSRKFQRSSICELLSADLLEETIQNQGDVDIEYFDIKERIEKYFKIEGMDSKLGIITLTSLENSLPDAARGGKVEIQFHVQHSKEEEVTKKDALSSAEDEKKVKADKSFNIFSDNKLEVEPDIYGMDTRVGINFVARIFQPSSQRIVKLDCFASENMFVKKLKIIPDSASLSSSNTGLATTSTHQEMSDIYRSSSSSKTQKKDIDCLYTAEFRLLNKDLQRSLYRYLSSTWHIGDDVNFFVLACSRQKEQQLYMNWLDKLCLFTAGARDMSGSLSAEGKSSSIKKRRSRSNICQNDSISSSSSSATISSD